MRKFLFLLITAIYPLAFTHAQSASDNESFISTEKGKGKFAISASEKSAPLLISSKDWPGVIRAFKDLQTDIGKVTSVVPDLFTDNLPESKEIIIAGTLGKSQSAIMHVSAIQPIFINTPVIILLKFLWSIRGSYCKKLS